MAEIGLDDVGKIYPGGTRAVADLSLDIADGEFMVFVGPSGCGKTTALRMVAGLEDISEGKITIGDRVVNDVPSKDRDVAMVFQNYALYPHLTVAENIGFGLKLRKQPKDEIDRRVKEAARILGLEEFLHRKPKALSGGQRQRVAMGRAIVRQPQGFLMDEPLSNLDAKLRVAMRAEISKIQRDLKVTTIYVTHDQVEAMTMGDRVAVIRKGLLQQVDAPQVLYDHPINIFVAGFIGSPAMNMTLANLEHENDQLWVRFGEHRVRVGEEVRALRPALESYVGRQVVLGIRPEDLEDASLMGERAAGASVGATVAHRFPAVVDLSEEMGSEVVIHFEVDSPPVLTEDTKELAADVGAEASESLEERAQTRKTEFVAKFSPRTRAKRSDRIDVAVDIDRLHFFDPETSASIWDGKDM